MYVRPHTTVINKHRDPFPHAYLYKCVQQRGSREVLAFAPDTNRYRDSPVDVAHHQRPLEAEHLYA